MTVPRITVTAPVGPSGAPLLLLGPSLGTSTILWENVIPLLQTSHRVVAWDLPGHGTAPAPTEGFTVAELADAVADAAAGLDADSIRYAGISLGGAVGIELLLRHPSLVDAAAIMCSGAKIGDAAAWEGRARQVRQMGTGTLIVGSAERWFAPGSMEREPVLTGRLLHALRDADDAGYAFCCDALAEFDVRDRLGEISAPVLAAWGEYDEVTPESSAAEIATGVRHGKTVRIADAAHLPAAEQPQAVASVLTAFFAEEAAR
ncbi:alpha/beta fold hydrolase [Microbacterium murale]|uniref:3-oxoadipate enol-lactonase n=1 Tax=Microbacterium murale TaxID=1081040 RepID=A0ABU0P7I5_9MICO|nr:alpha/beta fold hydrolase [Microbacterium murale]MDQ0643278.1 3-oxoadipate enol-lactonase [Microbacterium murale]